MNLLIVSPAFAPYIGVGALRMTSLAKYLVRNSHEVTILCDSPSGLNQEMINESIKINARIFYINSSDYNKTYYEYKTQIDLLLMLENYDLVLFSCGPFYGMKLGPYIYKKYNQKYIIEQRDLWLFKKMTYKSKISKLKHTIFAILNIPIEYYAVKYSEMFITVSNNDKKILQSRYFMFKHKFECVLNGFEEIDYKKLNNIITEGKKHIQNPYIVYFGKFAYYGLKNVEVALNAIKKVIDLGYDIRFVHVGVFEQELELIANKINFPKEALIQTGYLKYEEGLNIVQNAAIGMVCEYDEVNGYGTKLFDYIATDIPIVAYVNKSSEIAKLLLNADNAYICDSSTEISNAIINILDNKIINLGMSSRNFYSRLNQNKKYEKVLMDLIKS